MKTNKAKARKLPATIYVKWGDDDPSYLEADETPDYAEHGDTLGVYELVRAQRVVVTRELK